MLLSAIIAYLASKSWRAGSRVKFSYWFLICGILLPSLTIHNSLSNLSHSDMLKEFAGTKPLESDLAENESEVANVTKAILANMKATSKLHDDQVAALEHDLSLLYSGDSFSSSDAMQKTLDAVKKKVELDREKSAMIQGWPQLVKSRLDQTSLSDAQKEAYISVFTAKFSSSEFLSDRRQMMASESDWADATNELYSFANEHATEVVVTEGSIGIASDATREEFNVRLTRAKALLDNYVAPARKVDEVRSANMKSEGLTPSDLGLEK